MVIVCPLARNMTGADPHGYLTPEGGRGNDLSSFKWPPKLVAEQHRAPNNSVNGRLLWALRASELISFTNYWTHDHTGSLGRSESLRQASKVLE